MKDYILITSPVVAVVIIISLILFVVGFCVTQLLLQAECEKNKRLRDRNIFLRERLSETQQELARRGYSLPEVVHNVQMPNKR